VPPEFGPDDLHGFTRDELVERLQTLADSLYEQKEEALGPDVRKLERWVMLQTIDRLWVEHLTAMDEMRQGIGLQAYGQQDPLVA
jgi:preprotein translocase subunit SecA